LKIGGIIEEMQKIAIAILTVGVLAAAAYVYTKMDRAAVAERHNEAAKRRDYAEQKNREEAVYKRVDDCIALETNRCRDDDDCFTAVADLCFDTLTPALENVRKEREILNERYGK
jgi:hypothetical protein